MNDVNLLKQNNVDVEASLSLWGDMDSYNESLKEFKDSLNSKLANLEAYKNASDWNNYAILAHSIKSESKYLGFMQEAEVFLQHELKGKDSDAFYINSHFDEIRNTINKIIALLNEYFKDTVTSDNTPKSILIADDSNIILNFLEKNMGANYRIIKANDGKQAIAAIEQNNVYALLLDLNMPTLNGFEVLNYLKENNLIDKLPVVIITGDDTEETIQKAFSYPILDVLNKPFNENNINRVLESIESFYNKNE